MLYNYCELIPPIYRTSSRSRVSIFDINFNYFVEMSGLYQIKLDPFCYKCEDKCGGIFSSFLDKHLHIYGVNVCIRVFLGCEYKLCNQGNIKEIFNRELHKYTRNNVYTRASSIFHSKFQII